LHGQSAKDFIQSIVNQSEWKYFAVKEFFNGYELLKDVVIVCENNTVKEILQKEEFTSLSIPLNKV